LGFFDFQAGYGDDAHGSLECPPEHPASFITIDARHADIQEDHVRGHQRGLLYGRISIEGRMHLVTAQAERTCHGAGTILVIINDQYAHGWGERRKS
jgi:hypothetical protein